STNGALLHSVQESDVWEILAHGTRLAVQLPLAVGQPTTQFDSDRLIGVLGNRVLHLLMLMSCSASSDAWELREPNDPPSLLEGLAAQGMPAIVGFVGSMHCEHAMWLHDRFWEALWRGESIDRAVQYTRTTTPRFPKNWSLLRSDLSWF